MKKSIMFLALLALGIASCSKAPLPTEATTTSTGNTPVLTKLNVTAIDEFTAAVDSAEVFVNGILQGKTPFEAETLEKGVLTVRVQKNEFQIYSTSINTQNELNVYVEAILQTLPEQRGQLLVTTNEDSCDIEVMDYSGYVIKQKLGKEMSLVLESAGYFIQARKNGYSSIVKATKVNADSTTVENLELIRVEQLQPPGIELIIQPDSAQINEPFEVAWTTNETTLIDIDYLENPGMNGKRELAFSTIGTRIISATAYNENLSTTVADTIIIYQPATPQPQAPTLNFTITPKVVLPGELVTVSWSTNGHRVMIDQGIGVRGNEGHEEIQCTSPGTKKFTAIAYNKNGLVTTRKDSVYVRQETPPAPEITFSVSDSVPVNQPAVIQWATTNANQVEIDYIGTVGVKGKKEVTFTSPGSRLISATAFGNGGQTVAEGTVVVFNNIIPLPPTLDFHVNPKTITLGANVSLVWISDGTHVIIDQGVGAKAAQGSQKVVPTTTGEIIFTATALNDFNLQTIVRDTITVNPPAAPNPPEITLTAPDSIEINKPVAISWSAPRADYVDIDYLGRMEPNGKQEIIFDRPGTRTISATAANTAGTATAEVTVLIYQIISPPEIDPIEVPCEKKVAYNHWQIPAVISDAGIADIDYAGSYRVIALVDYNSGDDQKNETFFLSIREQNNSEHWPQDPNAGKYRIVMDDPGEEHWTERDCGLFYFAKGTNFIQLSHFGPIQNKYPEFRVGGGFYNSQSVYISKFRLEYLPEDRVITSSFGD